MTLYSLIDTDGNIIQSGITENPDYVHSDDTRLLPDNCPQPTIDYNSTYYSVFKVIPVAEDATEVQYNIVKKSNDELRSQIIVARNKKIDAEMWKYQRIDRHNRLNLPQIDDIIVLDQYINALCEIPKQSAFINNDFENIEWPLYPDATPVVYFR
jgi:hypothetical protein